MDIIRLSSILSLKSRGRRITLFRKVNSNNVPKSIAHAINKFPTKSSNLPNLKISNCKSERLKVATNRASHPDASSAYHNAAPDQGRKDSFLREAA